VIHHEQDVHEDQHPYFVAQTSNNRVIAARDLHCCLLPQCEALRTCRSGFPMATALTESFPLPPMFVEANIFLQSRQNNA